MTNSGTKNAPPSIISMIIENSATL
jgi:hypothetical protein